MSPTLVNFITKPFLLWRTCCLKNNCLQQHRFSEWNSYLYHKDWFWFVGMVWWMFTVKFRQSCITTVIWLSRLKRIHSLLVRRVGRTERPPQRRRYARTCQPRLHVCTVFFIGLSVSSMCWWRCLGMEHHFAQTCVPYCELYIHPTVEGYGMVASSPVFFSFCLCLGLSILWFGLVFFLHYHTNYFNSLL